MSMNMAVILRVGPLVAEQLGELADKDAAIARVLAGNPDPRGGGQCS
jgi:hypothetical protein